MSRIRIVTVAAAACTIAALGIAAPIAWADAPNPGGNTTARTNDHDRFTLTWNTATLTQQDTAPTGLSSGDTLQASYTLTGKRTGSADFACTAVGKHYLCQGIIRLVDGDIYTAIGPVDEHQPAAVVGGTRRYDGVRGQFTQLENSDGTGSWTLFLNG